MRFSKRTLTVAAGVVALLVFAALTAGIFNLRSESGDVFAPYSTYRADPLGMMALYGALQSALPGATVERYLRPIEELPDGEGKTFVIVGAQLGPDPLPILERIEAFAVRGGRVVIAFRPIMQHYHLDDFRDLMRERDKASKDDDSNDDDSSAKPAGDGGQAQESGPDISEDEDGAASDGNHTSDSSEANETGTQPDEPGAGDVPPPGDAEHTDTKTDEDGDEKPDELDWGPEMVDISERWAFAYDFQDPGDGFPSIRASDTVLVEPAVAWRSGLYFEPEGDAWKPVFVRAGGSDEHPRVLLMERQMGAGSLVLCSDSYFFSNEALRNDRAPELIAWVIGTNPAILFSEVHLGTQQHDRIMTLIRRYRLHGVLLGFLMLGILFVWKNSSTLVPRRDYVSTAARPQTDLQRSHQDGLDNLLARFVAQDELMETCLREWLQYGHANPKAPAIDAFYQSLRHKPAREPGDRWAVSAYNYVVQEIQKR